LVTITAKPSRKKGYFIIKHDLGKWLSGYKAHAVYRPRVLYKLKGKIISDD
jgi:hypothetical protein